MQRLCTALQLLSQLLLKLLPLQMQNKLLLLLLLLLLELELLALLLDHECLGISPLLQLLELELFELLVRHTSSTTLLLNCCQKQLSSTANISGMYARYASEPPNLLQYWVIGRTWCWRATASCCC